MRTTRTLLVGLVALAMLLAGCGTEDAADTTAGDATTTTAAPDDPIVVAFPIPGPAPYIDGYFENWDRLADEAGVTTIKTTGDWTPQTQAEQIDSLLAQNPDVFVIWAVDQNAILPSLARIADAGIPAIASNAEPLVTAFQYLAAYTGPNDVLQGRIAGQSLLEALASGGKVGMVRGTPGTAAHDNRAQGFTEAIESSNIELADDQSGAWGDVQLTYDIVSAMLQRTPDLAAVFVQDDGMSPGAAQAADDAGVELVIVGIGGSCAGKENIQSGKLAATTVQDPWEDARLAFEAAVAVARGETVENVQYMDPPIITSENVDSFDCHF